MIFPGTHFFSQWWGGPVLSFIDLSSIAGTGGTEEWPVLTGRLHAVGGAGLVVVGRTRNRIGTDTVVKLWNRGH